MMISKKLNVFLCLTVFALTGLPEDKPYLSDHLTGFQTVITMSYENDGDDPELCLSKPVKEVSGVYGHHDYLFHVSNLKYNNHLPKSARAPPLV
ncbi:hypothetical protein C8D91_2472 [Marinicella litoralis]|uniref:Uncharacterized protein n=2 Tax=Marinicella litoralis TaxID=644220 RepID=A0A4R6XHX3_9GAMM|nr:hypothetical protein C8D91_2472 [Marinicella litoralis]